MQLLSKGQSVKNKDLTPCSALFRSATHGEANVKNKQAVLYGTSLAFLSMKIIAISVIGGIIYLGIKDKRSGAGRKRK